MALTITSVGSGTHTSAAATQATGATVTASVGDWLVVVIATSDNGAGTAKCTQSVADSDGSNTYVERSNVVYDGGGAGTGAELAIYTCAVTSALASDTVTVSFSPDSGQAAIEVYRVQPTAGSVLSFVGVDATGNAGGSATTHDADTVSVTSGNLIFGCASIETDDTVTGDSDTTNGSWSTVSTILADGGLDASCTSCVTQYKVATSTGNQSWACTTVSGRDSARNYIVLKETAAYTIAANGGSYALTGTAASLEFGREVAAAAGSYSLTGSAASLEHGYEIAADGGSYAVTGSTATLIRALPLTATGGSYVVTGTDAALEYGRELVPDAGSYSLSGADASLEHGYEVAANAGSYALTGSDATLTYAPLGGYTIAANAGSYTLSGTDAALEYGFEIAADPGSYAITGTDATLEYSGATPAATGTSAGSYNMYRLDDEPKPKRVKYLRPADPKLDKSGKATRTPKAPPKPSSASLELGKLAIVQAKGAKLRAMQMADDEWFMLN